MSLGISVNRNKCSWKKCRRNKCQLGINDDDLYFLCLHFFLNRLACISYYYNRQGFSLQVTKERDPKCRCHLTLGDI